MPHDWLAQVWAVALYFELAFLRQILSMNGSCNTAVLKVYGLMAMAPISILTSRGKRATCTVARAGVAPVK